MKKQILRINGAVKRAACDRGESLLLSLGSLMKGGQIDVYIKLNMFASSPFACLFMAPWIKKNNPESKTNVNLTLHKH